MFTDGPSTPIRLEVLIDVLRNFSAQNMTRKMLGGMVQPEGLPELDTSRGAFVSTYTSARELNLINDDNSLKLTFDSKDKRTTRQIILSALDEYVLSDLSVEPYFALFYSYLLGLNESALEAKDNETWALNFERDVQGGKRSTNPFNRTKATGINRWLTYSGLGWYDPKGVFQPNPYERVKRNLESIFDSKKKLTGTNFMQSLARVCPELDGGEIFLQANSSYKIEDQVCTLGLSHALTDLHLDGKIRLICPRDTRGWSIRRASPPPDKTMESSDIDSVELL